LVKEDVMTRSLIAAATVVTCSVLLGAQAPAPGVDPIIGTWKLNVAKSTYSPGPRPPETVIDVRRWSALDNGAEAFVQSSVDGQGNPGFQIVVFKTDGKRYPVHTAGTLVSFLATRKQTNIMRTYRRLDPYTVEFITYTDGVAGLPSVRSVSKDGQTYIQTTKGTDPRGQAVHNVLVFDRVLNSAVPAER
jgi:hypothetical protein